MNISHMLETLSPEQVYQFCKLDQQNLPEVVQQIVMVALEYMKKRNSIKARRNDQRAKGKRKRRR